MGILYELGSHCKASRELRATSFAQTGCPQPVARSSQLTLVLDSN